MTTFRHGQFVWRELMSTNLDASLKFYTEVFGWTYESMPNPDGGGAYHLAKAGDQMVAGLMSHPIAGNPAYWGTAVSVADVEAIGKAVGAAGGRVLQGPGDVPGMGRYVYFADPQGGVTSGWHSTDGDGTANFPPKLGEFCWEQLNTNNLAGSFAFYEKVFGWTHKPFPDDANLHVFTSGEAQVASALENPEIPTHWLSYIVVDTIAAAYEKVKAAGGKVMIDHIQVPGIGAIGVIQDNVGAVVGVFEQPR